MTIKSTLLGGCATSIILLAPMSVGAQDRGDLPLCTDGQSVTSGDCYYADAGSVVQMPIEPNVELVRNEPAPSLSGSGFSISIDGAHIAGDRAVEDRKRVVDIALEKANVQVKFDGFETEPRLNVSTSDLGTAYQPGARTDFVTSTNYPAWVKRSQVIVRERGAFGTSKDVATYDVALNAENAVNLPDLPEGDYEYVLRVYDANGRFDETEPLPIALLNDPQSIADQTGAIVRAGEGEDRTAVRNINVYGGSVTVFGDKVANSSQVVAMGEVIPVDQSGKFVVQRILPPGDHSVGVSVNGPGQRVALARDLEIPENDIFFFGVADATIGQYLEDVPEGEDETYAKGRVGFYLKGRVKGNYLITAALDTGEDDIDNLLNGLDEKDPNSFLNRIDADTYYPVYGDDSTIVEDAPTSGKFYVRVEKDASHVLWGNFKADIDGNRYVNSQRALYGAEGVFRTQTTNHLGDPRAEVSVFAAQPERLQRRDVLRGTGGSAYFLRHQDITPGSETVSVRVVDADTGRVQSTQNLVYGEDYTVDYFQGVILLTQPLSTSTGSDGVVTDSALGGDNVELAVNYENTPAGIEVDDLSYGGRAEAWVTPTIRVGGSIVHEDLGADESRTQTGVDILYQLSDDTFVSLDYAQSEGLAYSESTSSDGGLDYETIDGIERTEAAAYSVRAQADLAEVTSGNVEGVVGGYYEVKEEGFFTESQTIDTEQTEFGVYASVDVNENLNVGAKLDNFEDEDGRLDRSAGVEANYSFAENWELGIGATHVEERDSSSDAVESRLDYAIRLTRYFYNDQEIYVFGQGSSQLDGDIEENTRYGIGGTARLNERWTFSGEVSDGTRGVGAEARLGYQHSANSSAYIGYRLDPDRAWNNDTISGKDNGQFVIGGTSQASPNLTYYGETSYDLFGERRSLTNAYGVTYTPNTRWTYSGSFELGQLYASDETEIKRTAVSFGATYADENDNFIKGRFEYRNDDADGEQYDRDTYLASAAASYKTNPNWRIIANADLLYSESDQSDILDGRYAEGSIGYAYRPIDNERFNALVKYTYLYDLPGADQVTIDGNTLGDAQRSHIFSADGNYDLNEYWTVGAKLGYRIRETADRSELDWTSNTAYLGVLRADYHVTHNWDVFGEVRGLHTVEAKSTDISGLAGVYRHFDNNFKIGIGYDWGRFTDDLRSTEENDSSIFLNVIAKF